jgi:transcription factor IIIB 90 kDa subunit
VMPHEATVEEQLPATVPTEAKLSLSDWKQALPNEIDLEIEDFFRTSKEEKEKEAIFNKINKDYIAQQERKENERLDMEAATKDQDVDDLAQAAGQARYKDVVGRNSSATAGSGGTYKSKRHRESGGDMNNNINLTTEEQLRAAVASRRVSRKINYDALSSIFDDDGSFASTKIAGVGPDEYGNNLEDDDDDNENENERNNNNSDIQEEVMI